MKRLILIAALALTSIPVAQPAHANCATSLQSSVERDLRSLRLRVDASYISCNGLIQLHAIFTNSESSLNSGAMKRRAESVLRREGLIR
ncbi:MAG: hypothetical protein AAF376_12170 [Pseudomonadota bacterium]